MIDPQMTLAEFLNTVVTDMADRETRFTDFTVKNDTLRMTFGIVLMEKETLTPAPEDAS